MMIIRGEVINKGKAEGEAVVSNLAFSFLGDLEIDTGKIMVKGHDLEGKSIKGKIFVFPTGKGSTAGGNVAFWAKLKGNTPNGMIIKKAEPVIAMAAIMNDIPTIHNLSTNPIELIKTGDYIKLDADTGIVEIIQKKGKNPS